MNAGIKKVIVFFNFGCLLFYSALAQQTLKFDFGNGKTANGYTQVLPTAMYSDAAGFGFETGAQVAAVKRKGSDALRSDFVTGNKPFLFSVKLPEGNYNVRLLLGDTKGTSATTVRAECRRAVLPRITTIKGEIAEVSFTVHVHDSLIAGANRNVRIKQREVNYWHWDNKLTLEFNDSIPKLCALEIEPAQEVVTVFLAGNSTVVDQAEEPYAAWGQMLPLFFEPGKVAVANYAESGESLSSFMSARRLEKVLSFMKPGDYLFIEFAHNDQKQKGEGIGPWTSYSRDLTYFISECRKKGGNPVLVTSMHRRNFDSTGKVVNTLGDYPAAMRKVAEAEKVPQIDLNNMSALLYEAWGRKDSEKGFVIYPANTFAGQDKALLDNTHFNPYGAMQMAKCVVQGMQDVQLPLAKLLKRNVQPFSPSKPDNVLEVYWPLSPTLAKAKPDGN
jgi:lysophospholipase L1-like esterase